MDIRLIPLTGIAEIAPGDDLAASIGDAIARGDLGIEAGDVLVVCQKVVSKAEGRIVELDSVEPGERARAFAREFDKNPAVVELALAEAREILRMENGHLITVTGQGWICANAGLDRSNQNSPGQVTLLPVDADRSAAELRASLGRRFGVAPAVIVSDTFGRPWRLGQLDVAIGAAGIAVVDDHAGRKDWRGRGLEHTAIAVADQLAAAAGLAMGKADGVPAVLVRGVDPPAPTDDYARASDLIRPAQDDLFR